MTWIPPITDFDNFADRVKTNLSAELNIDLDLNPEQLADEVLNTVGEENDRDENVSRLCESLALEQPELQSIIEVIEMIGARITSFFDIAIHIFNELDGPPKEDGPIRELYSTARNAGLILYSFVAHLVKAMFDRAGELYGRDPAQYLSETAADIYNRIDHETRRYQHMHDDNAMERREEEGGF